MGDEEDEELYSLGGTYVLIKFFQSGSHSDSDSKEGSGCLVLDLV
jgi:hypothetical protein